MKNLGIYRVITYLLLFVAAFMSVGVFTSLLAALANPVGLLQVFVLACVIIYTYCSWRFLVRGIDKGIPSKPVMRDLIKVNAYVSVAVGALLFIVMISVLTMPEQFKNVLEQAKAAQPPGTNWTNEEIIKGTRFAVGFLLTYGALLLIHPFMTFRLLKRFPQLFQEPTS
jgi:TRAP-type C4-dicarboxylate transport system permease small subunit